MGRIDRTSRGGFALIAVLWIIVGMSALALAGGLAAREAVASSRNRADGADAAWRAEGCLERSRAAVAEALRAAGSEPPGLTVWARMDRIVAESNLLAGTGCDVRFRPAGAALDVNTVSDDGLRRFLRAAGAGESAVDSLADALADWRDEDATPRPLGAEAAWYAANGLRAPRDGPLADGREVLHVRGWNRLPGIDTLLSVDPGRVPLNHAPAPVLASLPGFTLEAAARLGEMRMRGDAVRDLAAFPGGLSPGARDEILRRYPEFVAAATVEPDAWIVQARVGVGTPPAVSVVEVRLVRAAARAAVVRRRTWTE